MVRPVRRWTTSGHAAGTPRLRWASEVALPILIALPVSVLGTGAGSSVRLGGNVCACLAPQGDGCSRWGVDLRRFDRVRHEPRNTAARVRILRRDEPGAPLVCLGPESYRCHCNHAHPKCSAETMMLAEKKRTSRRRSVPPSRSSRTPAGAPRIWGGVKSSSRSVDNDGRHRRVARGSAPAVAVTRERGRLADGR